MYLKRITIVNKGQIKEATYSFPFQDENPMPIVLTGLNGSGKTLVLINMLNAYINLKNMAFNSIPETDSNVYYKVQTTSYTNELFSYLNVDFGGNYYCDLSIKDVEKFKSEYHGKLEHINLKTDDLKTGFVNKHSNPKSEDFDEVFLYFPVDRFYIPAWLNKGNKKLVMNANVDNFAGDNYDNSIVYNILEDIEQWLLDMLLDSYLYEMEQVTVTKGNQIITQNTRNGKNTKILEMLNNLLTRIYCVKDPNVVKARFGVSKKEYRRISVILKYKNQSQEVTVANSFSHLSSGEIMVFGLFANIIKNGKRFDDFKDYKGVVLIDEIDENLHIDFCKNLLPEIMSLFPKIQFIITSHSPFFLLGMKEKYNESFKMVNLPDFVENDVYNFEEIKNAFDIANKNYSKILKDNEILRNEILHYQKPVIMLEGKTDRKHLQASLEHFKSENKYLNVDVSFNDSISLGNDVVFSFIKNLAKSNLAKNKIIAIFDCDTKLKGIEINPGEMKLIENNVFVYFIPNPNNIPGGISIEQLYKDDDLKRTDENGRRLYLNNEFDKHCRLTADLTIVCENKSSINEFHKNGKIKVIDDAVYSGDVNIALTKDDFADNILNKNFNNVDFSSFTLIWDEVSKVI